MLAAPNSIVIDPDSRLTQLGLVPVCPEESYYFFESRAYGAESAEPLPALAAQWARDTFGIDASSPWIAPAPAEQVKIPGRPFVTISLGVGENPAKRIADPFEQGLIGHVVRAGAHVLIDEGAGGEEAQRVQHAIAASGAPPKRVHTFRGSFATFASAIARSQLYIGYDSAGQHVAAACGVPLLSIFAGFPSPRFFDRWRPFGQGKMQVVKVEEAKPDQVLGHALQSLTELDVL